MTERTTAAGQIWRNLPSAGPQPPQRKHSDLASALYPHLSQAAKAEEVRQARAQAEQQDRSRRTAENLDVILQQLRKERGR
jgi:hypothetical protein